MSFILFIFKFEILGKVVKQLHPEKIQQIDVILSVFQFDISGNSSKELHLENIAFIENILDLKFSIISDFFTLIFISDFKFLV
jgi:hypothetical protein